MSQTYLITGGTGYIGSHTVVALIEAGNMVVILDNLSNSKREVANRIERITGVRPELIIGDIRDRALLRTVFANHDIDGVFHFAGLKAVGDTERKPWLTSTITSVEVLPCSKKWRKLALKP